MESTGKFLIHIFNILKQHNLWVTLSYTKYTKPQKGSRTDRKEAKWRCDLHMCGIVFTDIFNKSSRSTAEQRLQHSRETFDVASYVNGRCKTLFG